MAKDKNGNEIKVPRTFMSPAYVEEKDPGFFAVYRGRSRALRHSTRASTMSPMLTTYWCLAATPPLLAWWSS